jgi:hypothetical protein
MGGRGACVCAGGDPLMEKKRTQTFGGQAGRPHKVGGVGGGPVGLHADGVHQARPVKPVEVAGRGQGVVRADAHKRARQGGRQRAGRRGQGHGRRRLGRDGRKVVLQEGVAGAAGGLALRVRGGGGGAWAVSVVGEKRPESGALPLRGETTRPPFPPRLPLAAHGPTPPARGVPHRVIHLSTFPTPPHPTAYLRPAGRLFQGVEQAFPANPHARRERGRQDGVLATGDPGQEGIQVRGGGGRGR